MNASQSRTVVVCGVLLALSLLFPPWEKTSVTAPPFRLGVGFESSISTTSFDGYGFVGSPRHSRRLSFGHLILQCVVICVVGSATCVCLADKR